MTKLVDEGFSKEELGKNWVLYTHEDGYEYFVKVFGEKLVMFDNFSVTPVVVSTEKLDEGNFEETLELVYSTSELKGTDVKLESISDYVSELAYKEAKEIFDYHFGV